MLMSIARHHNEWLSLIEISGPFLSLPVLIRTFPQGLEALDRDGLTELRLAYEEWLDDQNSLRPSPAIHSVWARYTLEHVLGFEKGNLLEGPAIPATLQTFVAEQAETLRPDLVIVSSDPSTQKPRMLVQVYPITQGLEKSMQNHRWKASPAMRMLELLRSTGVSLGLVTNGEQWMLVNAPKAETSAFVSWYAALWLEEPLTLRAFSSLLGATRFFSVADVDTLEGMLKDSVNEQQEVTDQLGYQVRRAVEVLIRAIDKADQDRGRALLKDIRESDLYEAALTVMMRLVFLFSAEERGLLLLGDPLYDQNYAVSTLRAQLRETADQQGEEVLERRFDAWCRLLATFRAVHDGIHHDRLNLPAYGGSLFDPDRYPFLEGRSSSLVIKGEGNEALQQWSEVLPISNRTVLHLLEALQILRVKVPGGGPAEARRLSFRALDVEQIGHVYEGLLDHIAVRASEPVLGLAGTREKEPEIPLSILLAEEAKSEKSFLAYFKEQTGRSENALHKALQEKPDVFTSQHLQIACNNDAKMFERVAKYAGLVREDDFGYPAVFLPGSVYVTAGATRRATGTHYTPRSLTEPIVQHTLEPLVYTGPAEGLPKVQWKLKSPAELLELKVCDMAMGSAGFLVQVVRYLSERLVETWDILEGENLQITPEGKPATGKPGELIIPKDDEEKLVLARRLVADRCIYGVDKNPLAVEIAKLSIWLTTMDKGRPFTFLDHALKCGDSLVGADEDMYRKWAYNLKGAQFSLYLTTLEEMVATARLKRKDLESFTVLDVRDAERKAQLLKEADDAMARVKLGCDLLVGVRLLGLKASEQEELMAHLLWDYVAGLPMDSEFARRTLSAACKERAFHWPFEFPEVFEKGGFSAFMGNPPFVGGRRIREIMGDPYRDSLYIFFPGSSGNADYCAFFFLKGYENINNTGTLGLIATNSISQGDTRQTALDPIVSNGGVIFNAINNLPWPGMAAVAVNIVYITKAKSRPPYNLDGKFVNNISSLLDSIENIGKPLTLKSNSGESYQGSVILGSGFVMSPEEAQNLIAEDPKNKEVLFYYLNGEDLNSHPSQSPSRWAINFFDWPLEKAELYSKPMKIVREKVKPHRDTVNRKVYRDVWWLYAEKQKSLYEMIAPLERVLVCSAVTKHLCFVFVPNGQIFNQRLFVFGFSKGSWFSVLQSLFHEVWVRKYSSTLETRLSYVSSDVFETYPFPTNVDNLEKIGDSYHEYRGQIMLARQEGLTTTYNRFHNPKETAGDIACLRTLHVEMDNAVAATYGWRDLDLGHGFHETAQGLRFTISEPARREVLSRLLQLNHERYEAEVKAGLHDDKKSKKKTNDEKPARQKPKKLVQPEGQLNFLAEPEVADEMEAGEPMTPTPTAEIGSWDRCKCLVCSKTVMGFSIAEHTQAEHQGKDPGYRKM
jgi:hypothetical protein